MKLGVLYREIVFSIENMKSPIIAKIWRRPGTQVHAAGHCRKKLKSVFGMEDDAW
jgi:hypothetical protein